MIALVVSGPTDTSDAQIFNAIPNHLLIRSILGDVLKEFEKYQWELLQLSRAGTTCLETCTYI
jgi:hypothetical protein